MNKTTNLDLKFLKYNQSQKEIVFNEAIAVLDIFMNKVIIKTVISIKEVSEDGRLYLISEDNIENEWKNKKGQIIFYLNGWRYINPKDGWLFWFEDKNRFLQKKNDKWNNIYND